MMNLYIVKTTWDLKVLNHDQAGATRLVMNFLASTAEESGIPESDVDSVAESILAKLIATRRSFLMDLDLLKGQLHEARNVAMNIAKVRDALRMPDKQTFSDSFYTNTFITSVLGAWSAAQTGFAAGKWPADVRSAWLSDFKYLRNKMASRFGSWFRYAMKTVIFPQDKNDQPWRAVFTLEDIIAEANGLFLSREEVKDVENLLDSHHVVTEALSQLTNAMLRFADHNVGDSENELINEFRVAVEAECGITAELEHLPDSNENLFGRIFGKDGLLLAQTTNSVNAQDE